MIIYNLVILLYGLVIRIASVKNSKAKFWVDGRKHWRKELSQKIENKKGGKKVWVHCASLGEFEQGRPLMEAIKKKYPDYKIILTFFSPSGFEGSKDYNGADIISYLPLDTRSNAKDFIEIVKPDFAIFIKYEFWINFLNEMKRAKINSYLVSAVFKNHHPFFKWYGGIFVRSLQAFKTLFVQDENSSNLLNSIGYNNVEITGDTRFDRVLEIKSNFKPIPEIEAFKGNNKLIIAGSTWSDDDDIVISTFKKLNGHNIKLIIAPHEIDDKSIEEIIIKLRKYQLDFSLFTDGVKNECNVLILNTMGMLSRSYFYADFAYIGGGFNDGIHNILEPAVYCIPVIFYGKDFSKFNEAIELVKMGCAFNVLSEEELIKSCNNLLQNHKFLEKLKSDLDTYFAKKRSATAQLMKAIDFS